VYIPYCVPNNGYLLQRLEQISAVVLPSYEAALRARSGVSVQHPMYLLRGISDPSRKIQKEQTTISFFQERTYKAEAVLLHTSSVLTTVFLDSNIPKAD